jgi:hypothetical protein
MPLPTKADKRQFVRELVAAVKDSILKDISAGKVPVEWDGLELRWLLADRFREQALPLASHRKRQYNNERVVNNL